MSFVSDIVGGIMGALGGSNPHLQLFIGRQ